MDKENSIPLSWHIARMAYVYEECKRIEAIIVIPFLVYLLRRKIK